MSYKTTRESIDGLLRGGRLFVLRPRFADDETPRELLVSSEVHEAFEQACHDDWRTRRFEVARAVLDDFTSGAWVTVAQHPFDKAAVAILARVHPAEQEVWDFRCLDPSPGIRIFGRFAERDTFVALTYAFREDLAGRDDWAAEVAGCIAAWSSLFGPLKPHAGVKVDEYISYNADPA